MFPTNSRPHSLRSVATPKRYCPALRTIPRLHRSSSGLSSEMLRISKRSSVTCWSWQSSKLNFRQPERRSRSEEHTSELQSPCNLVCRLLLEKKKQYVDTCATRTAS